MQRSAAFIATTALASGTLAIIAPPAAVAAEADRPIDQSYTYQCAVVAGALALGTHAVGVRTEVEVPAEVAPGATVSSRSTQITLTMPESLRAATVNLLSGKTAGGSSEDAAVDMEFEGDVESYLIEGLSAPQSPIPAEVDAPWLIPTQGTVPAIQVPNATGTATLSMPASFEVTAIVKTEPVGGPAGEVPATMDCTGQGAAERVLTTIDVQEPSDVPIAQNADAGEIGITAFGFGPKTPVTLKATGGRAPYTYAVASVPSNTTVAIDGATATLSTTGKGAASFTYTATDADGAVSAEATVSFVGINNAPLVRDLEFTIGKGKALDLWPYTRDDDYRFFIWQNYNEHQRVAYGDPSNGELSPFLTAADVAKPGWTLPTADFPELGHKQTYTPDPDFVGTDSFTYTATDSAGASSTATITVNVVEEEAVHGALTGLRYKCEPQDRDFDTGEEYPEVTDLLNYTMGGAMAFTVDTFADIPRVVEPGETFTPAPTKVDLVMPQGLAEVLVGGNVLDSMGFGQTEVGGSSDASARFVETATGKEYDLPLQGLEAEGVQTAWPVPSEGVRIPTVGTLDPVTAPAKGAIEVYAPQNMVIKSQMEPGILGAIKNVWLQCAAMPGQDLLIGTTQVMGDSITTATVAPAAYGTQAIAKVSIASAGDASGKVEVRSGSTVVGTANAVDGKADVRLKQLPVGKHSLKVRFLGSESAAASSTTVQAVVTKATSTVRAKVGTKKIRAKRTKAKIIVRVDAPRGHAAGTVKVLRKGKVVGRAKVNANGKVTVTLKKFKKAGTYRLVVSYAGNRTVKGDTAKIRVKVRK